MSEVPFEPKVVAIVNVAVVEPAGTVTELGTVATDEFEDDKPITMPPAGAAIEILIVPVEALPGTIELG